MHNNNFSKYREPSLISLVLFTFLSAILCMLLGYVFIPFAAGMYSALIFAEKKGKFFFSYLIPVITVVLNFFVNGFYSLEGIAFAAVGIVIYLLYTKNRTKNESVFWVTLLIIVLFFFSFVFLAFEETGTLKLSAIGDFYGDIYNVQKENFISILTRLASKNEVGVTVYLFNIAEAEKAFIDTVKLFLPLAVTLAFLLCGITMKIFSSKVSKYCDEMPKIFDWKFCPPSIVAYFFLIVSIISIFTTNGVLAESVMWLDFIFSFVFAYMGIKFLNSLSKQARGGTFFVMIFVLIIFLSASFAMGLLTYFGAFFTISSNKRPNGEKML